ncbi:sensor histidine kinase [Streptomyces sp. NBC_00986]|uniref:sensor histidine kinase n=1 Tax=Streptomyces sp. NBC_00986 TaxID=2903702 RepID=UPI003868B731
MNAKTMALGVRSRLGAAGMWSRRQIVGETVLAVVLALSMAMTQTSEGALRMVAVGVVAAVISLLRRAFPGGALLATGAVSGVLGGFGFVLIVVSWSAGARIEAPRRALAFFTAAYVLYVGLSVPRTSQPLSALQALVFITLAFLAMGVVPGLASRNRAQRRTLLRALHEHNAQLLREREMIASHSRLRERQRIAQDMHDSLGHQLALIAVHTGALEVDRELTGGQREVVGVLREASVSAMHELREAVGILRDGTPDQLRDNEGELETQARGVAGIDGLVEASRGAGTVVALRRTGRPRPLAPAADHAAFRIVQEALTNALKHAQGAAIAVELRYEPDSLVVEIANGPVPALTSAVRRPVVSGGQGLTGLQERARLVGGMVHAGPATDGGFRIAGVLPYGPGSPRAAESGRWPADPGSDGATFVDAANDFRGQSEGAAPGDGGADIDWSGAPDRQKEFDIAMGRKKKGFMIGCGSAVLAFVVLGVLAVVLIVNLVGKEGDKIMLDPKVYESVKVGDSETAVRDKLPHGKAYLGPALNDQAPAKPRGATCSSYLSKKNWPTEGGHMPAFRFCFKDGKLIEKRAFATKS